MSNYEVKTSVLDIRSSLFDINLYLTYIALLTPSLTSPSNPPGMYSRWVSFRN
jgi:hypothetical protein